MNYKSFDSDIWSGIEHALNDAKKHNARLVAAFDADGTLWDTDLSETLFNYQIENKLVELPKDPWDYYNTLKKVNDDPRTAFMWLAQINKGHSLEQLQIWAQTAFDQIKPSPIFSEQKKLIDYFLSHGVQVYIVTASVKWAVEPGALAVGLHRENVIGVETVVQNNLVTDIPIHPVTYRDGKPSALLKMTNGQKPFFASGNSIGDYELLLSATHFRLAVSAASRDDLLFKTEKQLFEKATELKWKTHRFI